MLSSSLSPSELVQISPQGYDYEIVSLSQWFNGNGSEYRVDNYDDDHVVTKKCMSGGNHDKNHIISDNTATTISCNSCCHDDVGSSASSDATTNAGGRMERDLADIQQRLPLIDLRSYESFSKYHLSLPPSSSLIRSDTQKNSEREKEEEESDDNDGRVVHLPFDSLQSGERSCELPPRNLPFAILIPLQKLGHKEDDLDDSKRCNHEIGVDSHNEDENSYTKINAIENFFFATRSKATLQSRKPWMVKQIIYENEQMWDEAKELGIFYHGQFELKGGKHGYQQRNQNMYYPLPRLWKPDRMVQSILLPLLKQKVTQSLAMIQGQSQQNEHRKNGEEYHGNCIHINQSLSLAPLTICDLGSGAGRDVCFLAEELNCHYYSQSHYHKDDAEASPPPVPILSTCPLPLTIIGIDNHKGSSKRCIPLWKYRNVSHITKSVLLDLNKIELLLKELENNVNNIDEIVCLYAIRFLNRKLLAYIAKSRNKDENNVHSGNDNDEPDSLETASKRNDNEILQKNTKTNHGGICQPLVLEHGTLFAMSHFCKPADGAPWNFDHPKEKSVLERNELRDLFTEDRWKILHDEISYDGDHGRTLVNFVAQRL